MSRTVLAAVVSCISQQLQHCGCCDSATAEGPASPTSAWEIRLWTQLTFKSLVLSHWNWELYTRWVFKHAGRWYLHTTWDACWTTWPPERDTLRAHPDSGIMFSEHPKLLQVHREEYMCIPIKRAQCSIKNMDIKSLPLILVSLMN